MYVLSSSFEFFTFALNLLGEVEAEDIHIKKMVDIYSFVLKIYSIVLTADEALQGHENYTDSLVWCGLFYRDLNKMPWAIY
jgi:hypothetical protein